VGTDVLTRAQDAANHLGGHISAEALAALDHALTRNGIPPAAAPNIKVSTDTRTTQRGLITAETQRGTLR
jgi:hypothetical protein